MKLAALFCALAGAAAQTPPPSPVPPRPVIRAAGDATVSSKPDQARIDIGVVTQAQTAQAAAGQNANATDAVVRQLKQAIGTAGSIRTVNYSLHPDYRYPQGGGKPQIIGYSANNTVEVTMTDLTQVGKVLDLATQSGANTINRLLFTLKDSRAARAQALREATLEARSHAEAMAAAAGVKIVRVLSIDEGRQDVIHPRAEDAVMMRATAAQAPTPVESGTVEVRAFVTLTVEVQ